MYFVRGTGGSLPAPSSSALFALPALLALLWAGPARADWPMARHDRFRTGATAGPADLRAPAARWRRYLGGSVGADQMLAADVTGDGVVEVVFVAGGRLVVKRPDDGLVWESEPRSLHRIDAIEDLDGDGIVDIVATGTPGLVEVRRGTDGALEWRTDPTQIGSSIGAVRLADFDGDGLRDLYVADAACGSTDSLGDVAFAFSFADGFAPGYDDGSSQRLWQLERGRDYACGVNDVVTDVTGDGRPDVVAFSSVHAWVFDGRTGRKVPSGSSDESAHDGYPLGLSLPYGVATTDPADLDGDGSDELVLYTNNHYDPSINSRAVLVLDWDDTRAPADRLHFLWRRSAEDLAEDAHLFVEEGAVDLDGDGRLEVVTSFREGGALTTYVFDGMDGTVRTRIPGGEVRAVLPPLAPGGRPTVLIARDGSLEGLRFSRFDVVPAPSFTLPLAGVARVVDRARRQRGSADVVPATLPLPEGTRGVLLREAGQLRLFDVTGGTATERFTFSLPEGLRIVSIAPQEDAAMPGPGLLAVRSDGYLLVLDAALVEINFGGAEFVLPGIRTGGYYSGVAGVSQTPAIASFGAASEAVVVLDSRGVLLRLDATDASFTSPPRLEWEWPGVYHPLLVDVDGDGDRDVVARDGRRVEAREADGTTPLFATTVATGNDSLFYDVVPFDGPGGALRLGVNVHDTGDGTSWVQMLERSGAPVWASEPIVTAGSGAGTLTATDVTGDGIDDALVMFRAYLRIYDGASGTAGPAGSPTYAITPIALGTPAGAVTHVAAGSVYAPSGVTIDGESVSSVWSLEDDYRTTRVAGTVIACGDRRRFVAPRYNGSRVAVVDVATGEGRKDILLAGGKLFRNETALYAAGEWPGLVGNATAVGALWEGQPAVLLGSTDGFLYAVDPCTPEPTLLWSLDFRAPVGEPTLGDVDGDGVDEIVVSVADGFLYGVDTEVVPSPAPVIDVDPSSGVVDADVDETRDRELVARWAAVPEATAYEYAVFTAGGTPVSRNPEDETNPFLTTTGTEGRWSMNLSRGIRYHFAVRALAADGASSEALSDGAVYLYEPAPPPPRPDGGTVTDAGVAGETDAGAEPDRRRDGSDGGCACRAAPRAGTGGMLGPLSLGGLAVLVWRRRRRIRPGRPQYR